MSESSDAYDEVINEVDIKSLELSGDDYEDFLQELSDEISSRLEAIEEDK